MDGAVTQGMASCSARLGFGQRHAVCSMCLQTLPARSCQSNEDEEESSHGANSNDALTEGGSSGDALRVPDCGRAGARQAHQALRTKAQEPAESVI